MLANQQELDHQLKTNQLISNVMNPEKHKLFFWKQLLRYNRPRGLVFLGFVCAGLTSVLTVAFGPLVFLGMFSLYHEGELLFQKDVSFWSWLMLVVALGCLLTKFLTSLCFLVIQQNMTRSMRELLYKEILTKHIGWFDLIENHYKNLLDSLLLDCSLLRGLSTEACCAIFEAAVTFATGLALAIYFDWQITCVFLAMLPLLLLANQLYYNESSSLTSCACTKKRTPSTELASSEELLNKALINHRVLHAYCV